MKHAVPLSINSLSIREKASLGALLHTSLTGDEATIDLTRGIPAELAPTREYRDQIVNELIENTVLKPNTDFDLGASASFQNIQYTIHVNDFSKHLSSLMYPEILSGTQAMEAMIMLREIQVHEAEEYMHFTLDQFHLGMIDFEPRYKHLFLQILKSYSLGQLFNFIYTAIRNQSAYRQQHTTGYVPLSNYIYKKIHDRFERALSEGWTIVHFNRNWGWQQSELSKLVHNKLLGIDESVRLDMDDGISMQK